MSRAEITTLALLALLPALAGFGFGLVLMGLFKRGE